jgi:hypothetical protein
MKQDLQTVAYHDRRWTIWPQDTVDLDITEDWRMKSASISELSDS